MRFNDVVGADFGYDTPDEAFGGGGIAPDGVHNHARPHTRHACDRALPLEDLDFAVADRVSPPEAPDSADTNPGVAQPSVTPKELRAAL